MAAAGAPNFDAMSPDELATFARQNGMDVEQVPGWQPPSPTMGVQGYDPSAKGTPADEDAIKRANAALDQKRDLANRADEFMSYIDQNGGAATGPAYSNIPLLDKIIPNVAQGVTDAFDPAKRLASAQDVNRRTWADLRQKGQGPIKGYESDDWKRAFPNVANWGQENENIRQTLRNEYNDQAAATQFGTQFVRSHQGSWADAMAAYAQGKRASQGPPPPGGGGPPPGGGGPPPGAAGPSGGPPPGGGGGGGGAAPPPNPRAVAQQHFMQAFQQRAGTLQGANTAWNKWAGDHFSDDGSQYFPNGQQGKLAAAQARMKAAKAPQKVDIWANPQ